MKDSYVSAASRQRNQCLGFCLRSVRGSKTWHTGLCNWQIFAKLKCNTVLNEPVSYHYFKIRCLKVVSMSTSMFSVIIWENNITNPSFHPSSLSLSLTEHFTEMSAALRVVYTVSRPGESRIEAIHEFKKATNAVTFMYVYKCYQNKSCFSDEWLYHVLAS